ncbi:hypothetical protein EYF80_020811 [Liparis tanakae]|uniref:Uncharacterized protein n=1 Tax=Liparis tanakae TaxID=230148 RepID=A0A4Z2HTG9_9TELE|nr:hypothetical protein EYF80_020811 [Liparis tanakae]
MTTTSQHDTPPPQGHGRDDDAAETSTGTRDMRGGERLHTYRGTLPRTPGRCLPPPPKRKETQEETERVRGHNGSAENRGGGGAGGEREAGRGADHWITKT